MAAIHQFVATLAPRDAIGDHCLAVQAALRAAGYRSEIYAHEIHARRRNAAHSFTTFTEAPGGEPTALLYHASIGSPVCEFLRNRDEPLVVVYHNITPVSFFINWEPRIAAQLAAGRRQLALLARRARLGLAVSAYNRRELDALEYRATAVAPILFDVRRLDAQPADAATTARLRAARERGGADWLFVGRLAPNKAQHDLVKAFAAYRRFHDPQARLHLVGGSVSNLYGGALESFVDELGLADCVDITGSVSEPVKRAYYEQADVFVVCSDHEGFLVPLLEAMHFEVPIVAYGAAAVPETLAGAGVVLDNKHPLLVAGAVARVLRDDALRGRLVAAGTARLADFDLDTARTALLCQLGELVAA